MVRDNPETFADLDGHEGEEYIGNAEGWYEHEQQKAVTTKQNTQQTKQSKGQKDKDSAKDKKDPQKPQEGQQQAQPAGQGQQESNVQQNPGQQQTQQSQQTPQQVYQQCISGFQNSAVGKVVAFGSMLSFVDNAWSAAKEWGATFLIKGSSVKVAELAGQSVTAAGETTYVRTVAEPILGTGGLLGIGAATVADFSARSMCTTAAHPERLPSSDVPTE
jgi:hypothetical protein